jgi:membrane associated rhomboid family serine protease
VTFTMMGICVVVYLVTLVFQAAQGDSVTGWVLQNLWLVPAQSHWWTYLTSIFVHEGFLHLAGNMVYLFLFGSCVEDVIGRPRFVAFYLLTGLIAEFSYIAFCSGHFASSIPMGGASGAISGCIGGFLLLFLRTKIEFKWVFFFFFRFWHGEFFLPAWLVISFWFLSDLAGMLLAMDSEKGGGVAFGAHVGGTLCGLALIALEKPFRKAPVEDEPDELPAPAAPVQPVRRPVREPIRIQLKSVQAGPEVPAVYLYIGQNQSGPFDSARIHQMFVDETMPLDALYWREGMPEWRNVEELRPAKTGYGI